MPKLPRYTEDPGADTSCQGYINDRGTISESVVETWRRLGFEQKRPGDAIEYFYSKELGTHLSPGLCAKLAPLIERAIAAAVEATRETS